MTQHSSPESLKRVEAESPALLEDLFQSIVREVRVRVEHEPAKVLGVAAVVWATLQVIPRPWIARGVSTFAHAAIMALGVCKALEMLHAANESTLPLPTSNPTLQSQ